MMNLNLLKPIKLSVVLILSCILMINSPALAETTLLNDNFEDGNADDWTLWDGFSVEDDNGNFVLSGSGHIHSFVNEMNWPQLSSFQADVKLVDEESRVHLLFRNNSCERYFIGFSKYQLDLSKTYPCDTHTTLAIVEEPLFDLNTWYTIKITGDNQGNIKVYVNDVLKIDYDDTTPLLTGTIGFEVLTDSKILCDNVIVKTKESKATSSTPWEFTGGPLGGLGYDIRINPIDSNKMYVTDNFAGVLISTDKGQNWKQSNEGISIKGGTAGDTINIFSLTIDPNNPDIVWAGTFGSEYQFGAFKSLNGGENWELKKNGISLDGEQNIVFRGFTVQPGNSNVVYAQVEIEQDIMGLEFPLVKGRVYKTIDGGESWTLIWQGDNLARYLIIDPTETDTLYLSTGIFDREANNSDCTNDIPGGEGVLKSTDGGKTWRSINNGLTDLYVGTLRMHPSNPQILFAGTGNNACSGLYEQSLVSGLFKTIDGGASWKMVLSKAIIGAVNFSPSNPDIIYAGSSAQGFFRSEDGGETWQNYSKNFAGYGPEGISAGIPIDVVVDAKDPDMLYVNNYQGGVFRSVDGAQSWEDWSKGYSGAEVHNVEIPKTATSTVYAVGRSGPFKSIRYGNTWKGIATGDLTGVMSNEGCAIHPTNHNIILLSQDYKSLYRSSNGGDNFLCVLNNSYSSNYNRAGFYAIEFSISNPDIVFTGVSIENNLYLTSNATGPVIYKSSDAGISFSAIPSILDGSNVRDLEIDAANSKIVYAATTNGVFKTTDGGTSWTQPGTLAGKQFDALALDPDQSNFIIIGEIFGGIWISEDGGDSWTGPHNTGFNSSNPHITAIEADPSNSKTFFASDLYSGVYRSQDNGKTWALFPDWQTSGLSVRAVKDIAVNKNVIYAATIGGGVFRYMRDEISTEDPCAESPAIEEYIVLMDATPNATVVAGSAAKLYGTGGRNHVTLESGAHGELGNFPGNNKIIIESDSSIFTVSRSGAYVTFEGTDCTVLKIPVTLESQTIVFNDGSLPLIIDSDKVMLGEQEISLTPSTITDLVIISLY